MLVVLLRLFFAFECLQKVMLFHYTWYVYNHQKIYCIILFFSLYLQSWFCCCSLHQLLLSGFSDVPRIIDSNLSEASLLPLYREMITFSPLFSFFSLLLSSRSLFFLISVLFQHNFCLSASVSHCELTFIILASLLPSSPISPVLSALVFVFMLFYNFVFICCVSESFLFSTLVRTSSNLYVTVT